jgi:pyruvate formate lyase activating enzyme
LHGINTAVETCGFADPEIIKNAALYTDLLLWDIKDTDTERHRRYTGAPNVRIIENLRLADGFGMRTRLRCILVRGVNTDDAHYNAVASLAASLKNCEGVEFIKYHAYGGAKSTFLGLPDNGNTEWIPKEEELDRARAIVFARGIKVY